MKHHSKELFDKRYRYSIRRLTVGIASVAVGCLLFGTNVDITYAQVDSEADNTLVMEKETVETIEQAKENEEETVSSESNVVAETPVDNSTLEIDQSKEDTNDGSVTEPEPSNDALIESNAGPSGVDSNTDSPERENIPNHTVDETETVDTNSHGTPVLRRVLGEQSKPIAEGRAVTTPSHVEVVAVKDQELSLGNEFINRHLVIHDGKLRTTAIENKLTREQVEFAEDSKEFVIQFKPGENAPVAPSIPSYIAESEDRAQWIATTNSAANQGIEGPIAKTLDGDLVTRWHSNYHGGGGGSIGTPNQLPAHAEFTFPTPKNIRTFIYVPRQDGADNGIVKDYKIYIKQERATDYSEIKAGTITENPKQIQYIDLGELKTNVKAIKFEVLSAVNGQPFAAASEFDVSERTAEEIKVVQEQRRKEYLSKVEEYKNQFQISLDKLTLAKNGITRQTDADGETLTFTFNPYTYNNVPVTVKYIINLKKDAKFSQSHLELSVPDADKTNLTIDTIDLQSFNLKAEQQYEDFSKQAAIAEMGGFKGFYAGLGQPVYMGSFYTGSEFPTALNSVDENRKLFSRYYSGKNFEQLSKDKDGIFRTWNTVIGVARSDDYSVVQQDFFDYLSKIGQDTYFRKQYNSWFDHMKDITAENIQSSFNEIERGFTEGGVSPLHSYVVDDGWQTVASFWDFNQKFPNKLYDSSKQVKRFGSDFGLWLGPQGGYGNPGVMADHLAHTNQGSKHAGVVYIGDKRYTDGLTRLFAEYDKEFDINYWKLDGLLLNPRSETDEHGIGGGHLNMYSMTETHERWIHLYETIRKHATDPDKMWINLTSYIPPSPWFLQWVNSIWMQNAGDVDYQDGVKKQEYRHLDFGSDAAEAITYRDDRYEELVKLRKWQLPFANIYNHDPVYGNTAHSSKRLQPGGDYRPKINFSTDELRTYLYMLGTRGTGFWEFYYSPSMMDTEKWQVNGEAVKWIEENYDILKHAVFHGGKPGHGEVYGYSAWDEDQGILSIRNPIDRETSYTVTLDRLVGMREGTSSLHRTTVLGDKRHDTTDLTSYGDSVTITLKPYETVIFQYSKIADTTPAKIATAKANEARTITLEFDERIVLDEASHFSVSGHTVTDTRLNPDYRTVVLTLGEDLTDRESVTVTYSNIKDNAPKANLATGTIPLIAYDKGVIEDIHSVNTSETLENAGVTGKGVFSVTAKVNLANLNQTIAEQKGQWRLAVDQDGKVIFDVKGLKVESAPFSKLKAADKGLADHLITTNEDVTITAVRTANGSLKLYIDGKLHNSSFDAEKVNEDLEASTLSVGSADFQGDIKRFILENLARDFETAASLNETLNPKAGLIPVQLEETETTSTSYDPNDGGPRPAGSATDGDPSSYWVSNPDKDNRNEKQHLVIAMKESQTVSEVRYTPRQAAANAVGNIKKAYLEYSVDGKEWQRVLLTNGDSDNTITMPDTTATTPMQFQPVTAKFFRLTALDTHHWQAGNQGKVVAVAELTPVVMFIPKEETGLTTAYLRNALEQAMALDKELYTPESLAGVRNEIPASETALRSSSQENINQANNRLRMALRALEKKVVTSTKNEEVPPSTENSNTPKIENPDNPKTENPPGSTVTVKKQITKVKKGTTTTMEVPPIDVVIDKDKNLVSTNQPGVKVTAPSTDEKSSHPSDSKETDTDKTLPNTGFETGIGLTVLGILHLAIATKLKRRRSK